MERLTAAWISPAFEFRQRQEISSSPKTSKEFSGVQPTSISMDTGPPSRGEVDHLPPPNAEELYLVSTCLS